MERVRDRGRAIEWKRGAQTAVDLGYERGSGGGPAGVELREPVEALAVGRDRVAKRDAGHWRPCRVRVRPVLCRSAKVRPMLAREQQVQGSREHIVSFSSTALITV
jgi:hypothetical protein